MACFIFGAGDFHGLQAIPREGDYIIAADGGWRWCQRVGVTPHLLLGDFDSLEQVPSFSNILRVPVEKDDTDMMLAIKEGLRRGQREFHIYGGLGGVRGDHTIANLQALLYLASHEARGWLYGSGEVYTAIRDSSITFPARPEGTLSVFCFGADAEGVTIRGGQYEVEDAVLTSDFPLGVSNHFIGAPITVSVRSGSLLIGLLQK
ncbi:MAG: thiamine diphosphokinase [Ruminococcaceae bacterium]|nr:thiamine diphosphokinase [Oscillospiraceae bacterium]